jgi:cysteine synthase A/O-ureido-L-serine/cysteine synthase
MPLYDSILDTIGRTPIVKLHKLPRNGVTLYAKVEFFNPGGSVKDRLALSVILDAELKGLLKPGDTIVECTSGNVGLIFPKLLSCDGNLDWQHYQIA